MLTLKENKKNCLLKNLFKPIESNNNFYTLKKEQSTLKDLKENYMKKRECILKNAVTLNISKK